MFNIFNNYFSNKSNSPYLLPIFTEKIHTEDVKIIFELGSLNLKDARKLYKYYNCPIYAFECNPDSLELCNQELSIMSKKEKSNIFLIKKAVSIKNKNVQFYPFDLLRYNNAGASSMFKIDFSTRYKDDLDYNKPNPQTSIIVEGVRLDTFCNELSIEPDLICIDLQGYELMALKSLGKILNKVKYIITETSIESTYKGGASFVELEKYLSKFNYKYICSNKFNNNYPNLNLKGYSEFDTLFIKQ